MFIPACTAEIFLYFVNRFIGLEQSPLRRDRVLQKGDFASRERSVVETDKVN